MRLTIKLTVILVALVVIAMTAQALRTSRHLAALHLRETQEDFLVLAAALASATSAMLPRLGHEQALADLVAGAKHHTTMTMRVVPRESPGVISLTELRLLLLQKQHRISPRQGDALVVRVALAHEGTGTANLAVELRQSLRPHREYVAEMRRQQLVDTAVLSTVCGGAMLLLGVIFIGRPVRLLLGQAIIIGHGDFSLRSPLAQRDELGTLAEEMDHMSERLARAKRQAREENRARIAALDQLRHADRLSTVGKIASGIAHEVGTPLNVIVGRAAMIAAAEGCPAELASSASIIGTQANHVARIIRQLLDFARNGGLCRHTVDIADIIGRARLLLEPLADDRGVSIAVHQRSQVVATVDEGKLLQVITNLIMNAVQAMPRGGVIDIDYELTEVAEPPCDLAAGGTYLSIAVRDQGVGIPPDKVSHIFEPFFTTKADGEGTGLGLPICDGIVREHGGFITVTSEVGKGSVFTVYIPQGGER